MSKEIIVVEHSGAREADYPLEGVQEDSTLSIAKRQSDRGLGHILEEYGDACDLLIVHPRDAWNSVDSVSSVSAPTIIFSGEYIELDSWDPSKRIVRLPKGLAKIICPRVADKLKSIRRKINLQVLVNEAVVEEASTDRHQIRNRFGPATLLEIGLQDGLSMGIKLNDDKYNELIKNLNKYYTDNDRRKLRKEAKLPVPPCPELEYFNPLTDGSILMIDDDHQRGWSTVLALLLLGSCKDLYAVENDKFGNLIAVQRINQKERAPHYHVDSWDDFCKNRDRPMLAVEDPGRTDTYSGGYGTSDSDIILRLAKVSEDEQYQYVPFDLAFIDYRVEDEPAGLDPRQVSGSKIVKWLHNLDPSLPIIVFTASEHARTPIHLMKYEIHGYYLKPGRIADEESRDNYRYLKELIHSAQRYRWSRTIWRLRTWLPKGECRLKDCFLDEEYLDYLRTRGQYVETSSGNDRPVKKCLETALEKCVKFLSLERRGLTEEHAIHPFFRLEVAQSLSVPWDILFSATQSNSLQFKPTNNTLLWTEPLRYCIGMIQVLLRNMLAHGQCDPDYLGDEIIQFQVLSLLTLVLDTPFEVAISEEIVKLNELNEFRGIPEADVMRSIAKEFDSKYARDMRETPEKSTPGFLGDFKKHIDHLRLPKKEEIKDIIRENKGSERPIAKIWETLKEKEMYPALLLMIGRYNHEVTRKASPLVLSALLLLYVQLVEDFTDANGNGQHKMLGALCMRHMRMTEIIS